MPHICERICWWWINGSPTQLWKRHCYGKPICFLIFLHGPLHLNCMNLSGVSIHSHCFCVSGHQIEQPRWSEVWSYPPDWGPHYYPTKWPKQLWRSRGILECPILITIPVSGEETWLTWDPVLLRNTGDLHQGWENTTTTISCMAGANCGRHSVRWQSLPNRSCSDWPMSGHPVLWVTVNRRGTELGWGMRCCIYAVRCHQ